MQRWGRSRTPCVTFLGRIRNLRSSEDVRAYDSPIGRCFMRSVLLVLVTVLVATAAFADDATLMLRKSGNCSGVVTAVDRDTRQTLASCGFGCTERAVQI